MIYAQPSNYPREWHTWTPLGLWQTHGSDNFGQKTWLYSNQQQKREFEKLSTLLSRLTTE